LSEENPHDNLNRDFLKMKNKTHTSLLLCVCILLIPLFVQFLSDKKKINPEVISASSDLSYWGMTQLSQIRYVSLGISHKKEKDELIIYNIRKEKPDIRKPASVKTLIPETKNGIFLLDDFEVGNVNRLGGYFNEFHKPPSNAIAAIESVSENNKYLCFRYSQREPGYSGFWIHLFDMKSAPYNRVYLDASKFKYLTFSIRGEKGDEKLLIKAADRVWERKEDSLTIGFLKEYLPASKITTEWQRVWIPFSKIDPKINIHCLASIVFSSFEGEGVIYLDDIAFTAEKNSPVHKTGHRMKEESVPNKGMWLWETDELLKNRHSWDLLRKFCTLNRITEIFMQLPYTASEHNGKWNIKLDHAGLQSLIYYIHRQGIKVHALDGDPRFALKKWHKRVISTINAVIKYNSAVSQEARFDGIRYDNEPYILPYFAGVRKKSIISQYVSFLKFSKDITAKAGLEFGVDIPFWFDENNKYFEPTTMFRERPLSEWVIDIADNVGVMDYRTKAYGPDGTIAHVIDEVKYAEKKGKKIWVGLETRSLPDETLLEFGKKGKGKKLVIQKTKKTKIKIQVVPEDYKIPDTWGTVLYLISETKVPSEKITFSDKNTSEFENIMSKTRLELNRFSSFYGFAVHYYDSYKKMIENQKEPMNQ